MRHISSPGLLGENAMSLTGPFFTLRSMTSLGCSRKLHIARYLPPKRVKWIPAPPILHRDVSSGQHESTFLSAINHSNRPNLRLKASAVGRIRSHL